jgi:hypothetical protein
MNKVDGLIIFDLEEAEMEDILHIKNSIHRKRLRNGRPLLDFEFIHRNKYSQTFQG